MSDKKSSPKIPAGLPKEILLDILNKLSQEIALIGRDYRIMFANESKKRRLGRIKHGDMCYKAFEKRDSPCKSCPSMRAMEVCEAVRSITESDRDDDSFISVESTPLLDAQGNIYAVLESVTDLRSQVAIESLKPLLAGGTSIETIRNRALRTLFKLTGAETCLLFLWNSTTDQVTKAEEIRRGKKPHMSSRAIRDHSQLFKTLMKLCGDDPYTWIERKNLPKNKLLNRYLKLTSGGVLLVYLMAVKDCSLLFAFPVASTPQRAILTQIAQATFITAKAMEVTDASKGIPAIPIRCPKTSKACTEQIS